MSTQPSVIVCDSNEALQTKANDILLAAFSEHDAARPFFIGLSADQCAVDYEKRLRSLNPSLDTAGYPVFDVLFLGMGPDGHTCSLFPNHPVLEATTWVAPVTDSPKPPPNRVTLTLPVVNAAKNVVVIATGAGKVPALKEILDKDDSQLPAARVKPKNGKLFWLVDPAARPTQS